MPTCLITGCEGFIGSHLADFLLANGCRVFGAIHRETRHIAHLTDRLVVRKCDVTDRTSLVALVRAANPDFVFHLAAQVLSRDSWEDPEGTFHVNVLGTLSLLEVIRNAEGDPVVQIAGSSAEYGPSTPEELRISEAREPRPMSPYAASKTAVVHVSRLYAMRYGMRVHCIRPFQFIGPRKYPDVCSEFAKGIVEIERGSCEELRVGNLDPVRDMLDVRDGVNAMWLIARSGRSEEVYNICSGVEYSMREVLERLIILSGIDVRVREDPARVRVLDLPVVIGDNRKLRRLGVRPG